MYACTEASEVVCGHLPRKLYYYRQMKGSCLVQILLFRAFVDENIVRFHGCTAAPVGHLDYILVYTTFLSAPRHTGNFLTNCSIIYNYILSLCMLELLPFRGETVSQAVF